MIPLILIIRRGLQVTLLMDPTCDRGSDLRACHAFLATSAGEVEPSLPHVNKKALFQCASVLPPPSTQAIEIDHPFIPTTPQVPSRVAGAPRSTRSHPETSTDR